VPARNRSAGTRLERDYRLGNESLVESDALDSEAVQHRHVQIENDEIGQKFPGAMQRLDPIARRTLKITDS